MADRLVQIGCRKSGLRKGGLKGFKVGVERASRERGYRAGFSGAVAEKQRRPSESATETSRISTEGHGA